MQTVSQSTEFNTIKPLNITHELASGQNNEKFTARGLANGLSFNLVINSGSKRMDGEFGIKKQDGDIEILEDANFFLNPEIMKNTSPKQLVETVATLINLGVTPEQIGQILQSLNENK